MITLDPNLIDAVPQPSTSSCDVKIPTISRGYSYTVIRTDEMKMNLRKISNPRKYEIDCSEDEDVFAEESSEYEPSESGISHISSEDNQSMPRSVHSDNEKKKSHRLRRRGKKRTRNPENWKMSKAKFLKNSGKTYQSRTGKTVM